MNKQNTTEISLDENKIYVVKDQKITEISAPDTGFGKQEFTWHGGKVTDIMTQSKTRL